MAHLHRLAVALCLLLSLAAHATITATTTKQWYGQVTGQWYSDLATAGQNSVPFKNGCTGYSIYDSVYVSTAPPDSVNVKYSYCNDSYTWPDTHTLTLSSRTTTSCVANSTQSGSNCVCNSGYTETNGACISTVQITIAQMNAASDPRVWIDGPPSLSFCQNGITITGTASAQAYDGKQSVVYGPFSSSGAPCTAGTGSPAPDTSITCASGQFPGTVNGVAVCAPSSNTNTLQAVKTNTASAPGGSASAPTSGLGPQAPASAASSSGTTACTGSSCTTTTTYKDASGNTVGTATSSESKGTFCQENPSSPLCVQSSYSAVDCNSPPACTGDAVQCAVAAQSFKTQCALTTAPTGSEMDAYVAAKASNAGDQTLNLAGNSTVNISSSSFDATELLGTATGASDLTVTVMGRAVTLPFSMVNDWLAKLGIILQACTFLLCARIVTRG